MKKLRHNHTAWWHRPAFVLALVILLGGFLVYTTLSHFGWRSIDLFTQDSVLFVGDVFLGRNVEILMEQNGHDYPFRRVGELLDSHRYVVGNFEAAIPREHIPTPTMNLKFSVPAAYAAVLARSGFTHMSLANNHALDYDRDGWQHTEKVLTNAGVRASGHPQTVRTSDIQFFELEESTISLIPLHLLWADIPPKTKSVIDTARAQSDHVIVFVHWGDEYMNTANKEQERLAHTLIDYGADVIIGHHPHVVQNISRYNGGLIFYSLGNFIFDQYWEDAVQQGLTLSLTAADDGYAYTLIPVTSVDARSAPRPMNATEQYQFLRELAARSDSELQEKIHNKIVTFP